MSPGGATPVSLPQTDVAGDTEAWGSELGWY